MEIKKLVQESFFRDKLIHHRLIFFLAGGVSEAVVPIYIVLIKPLVLDSYWISSDWMIMTTSSWYCICYPTKYILDMFIHRICDHIGYMVYFDSQIRSHERARGIIPLQWSNHVLRQKKSENTSGKDSKKEKKNRSLEREKKRVRNLVSKVEREGDIVVLLHIFL